MELENFKKADSLLKEKATLESQLVAIKDLIAKQGTLHFKNTGGEAIWIHFTGSTTGFIHDASEKVSQETYVFPEAQGTLVSDFISNIKTLLEFRLSDNKKEFSDL